MRRGRGHPLVHDRVARQGCGRDAGNLAIALDDGDVAVVGHGPDDGDRQAPPLTDLADGLPAIGSDHREHPFLRLRDQDLERRHSGLTSWDRVELHANPRSCPVGRLGCRAGDAAGAEILEALDEAQLDQLEARLDEQLLRRVEVGERRAGEDARPADPVAAGRRSEQHREVAWSGRGREGQQTLLEQPDRHHVDEWIALVARVEDELAADRRHADAVAIATDAVDNAVHEVPRPNGCGIAEAERVEDRDRAGAHREDVAKDAADTGRRALVGVDRTRVVVGLDLERDRESVPDRDHPGIIARPGDDALAGRRQRP